jgi:citronellol/citronellal dehydrogenase
MGTFKNKVVIITGASRGIGRAIALKLAEAGASLVLAAKTKDPHAFLEGTIESVAEEVQKAGGKALPFQIDLRNSDDIDTLINTTISYFGHINGLINNAGAIYLTDTLNTPSKQFDLMFSINVRATFLLSRAAMPYLIKAGGGHIINLSPPISLAPKWLAPHVAYSMSKYGMSFCSLAMAEEFKTHNIAVNSLWPKTLIYTAAIKRLMGEDAKKSCRRPEIMADAAAWLLACDPKELSGKLFYDEEVLALAGQNDLSKYRFDQNTKLLPDLYVS